MPADEEVTYGMLSSKELDERLERWSDWARCPDIGAISTEVGYMKERTDIAADSAEMTPEIEVTERAMARTKSEDKAYWRVISGYYLKRRSIIIMSLFWRVSEKSLKRLFDEAKGRIGWHIFEIEDERLTKANSRLK